MPNRKTWQIEVHPPSSIYHWSCPGKGQGKSAFWCQTQVMLEEKNFQVSHWDSVKSKKVLKNVTANPCKNRFNDLVSQAIHRRSLKNPAWGSAPQPSPGGTSLIFVKGVYILVEDSADTVAPTSCPNSGVGSWASQEPSSCAASGGGLVQVCRVTNRRRKSYSELIPCCF